MFDVTHHLPHEPPMVLIDGMVSIDALRVVCQCTIDEDFVFLVGDRASPVALLEVAAQAAAVYMGTHWRTRDVGFLASCRTADFFIDDLVLGDVLRVEAALLGQQTERSASFECTVSRGGERVACIQLLLVRAYFEAPRAAPGS